MAALETQLDTVDAELRRFARADERCQALQSIYGIGPILACHLLAEIVCVLPVRRPLAVTAGLATPAAAPMHTIAAALPIVTSLRKSWPLTRPAHATCRLTQLRRRRAAKDCVYQAP
jgi:hypothetical protein